MSRTTVVIATRNRCADLCRTLDQLTRLPEKPPVIVVDNASTDGTARHVQQRFPEVRLLWLPENLGTAARNRGVAEARTPYVAFSDDDSWWEPGALERAEQILDDWPRVGLVAGRTLVGPDDMVDPISLLMWRSPLRADGDTPGRPVLGFLACSAIVRRAAFLEVGGFADFLLVGGEERLLAYDLAVAGWRLAHAPDVVAHHHPSPSRDPDARRALEASNNVLIDWLRRPWPRALGSSIRLLRAAVREPVARRALRRTATLLPALLADRYRLPDDIERDARILEAGGRYGVAA